MHYAYQLLKNMSSKCDKTQADVIEKRKLHIPLANPRINPTTRIFRLNNPKKIQAIQRAWISNVINKELNRPHQAPS